MNYEIFTTKYTPQIIDDVKEYLKETNKEQTTLDTLDLCHLVGEIERLNNIINELEVFLKEGTELVTGCGITKEYIYAYENALDKLQELKGSDK